MGDCGLGHPQLVVDGQRATGEREMQLKWRYSCSHISAAQRHFDCFPLYEQSMAKGGGERGKG